MYNNLQDFILDLENANELIRIKKFVDPVLEITEITDRFSKEKNGGKAILFENTGTKFPLLINSMGSYKRISMVFGVKDLDEIAEEIENLFKNLSSPKKNFFEKLKMLPEILKISNYFPKIIDKKGQCQEVINKNPDLSELPILKCWPRDGGRFITLPMVNTKDPITKIRNLGMYRMQVFSKNLTGMHWHKHKVGARHYNEYKKLNKKMPVVVTLGGDPIYTYTATAPLPDNMDEYMFAGFLRKKTVKLVKCITQDLEVPEDVDFVIEGYVDPNEELIFEGPFGDHTGFYSLADWYPKFHITCITHKKNAIYPATIVGIPNMEDTYIAKATERIFIAPIKMTILPELKDMNIPAEGTAHNLTIVKIEKSFEGHSQKVMNALWGAGQMMFNKILIVTDKNTNIHDYEELAKIVTQNIDVETDITFIKGVLDVLDHASSKFAFGKKMCIDATEKFQSELRSENINTKTLKNIDINEKKIFLDFTEIKKINYSLLKKEISIVFIAVEKKENFNFKKIAQKLFNLKCFEDVKILFFLDEDVAINDISICVWIITNNLEPVRDTFILNAKSENEISHIALDGTRKNLKVDNFKRDWPNVVISDNKTINKIDEIWKNLNIGKFIPSPSLKFRNYVKNESAIFNVNE